MENCQVGCLVLQDRRVCPDSTHNKTDSRTEPAALNPSNSGFAGLDLSGSAKGEGGWDKTNSNVGFGTW
jgi:hypothetical protein